MRPIFCSGGYLTKNEFLGNNQKRPIFQIWKTYLIYDLNKFSCHILNKFLYLEKYVVFRLLPKNSFCQIPT